MGCRVQGVVRGATPNTPLRNRHAQHHIVITSTMVGSLKCRCSGAIGMAEPNPRRRDPHPVDTPLRGGEREWCLIAEQAVLAPHLAHLEAYAALTHMWGGDVTQLALHPESRTPHIQEVSSSRRRWRRSPRDWSARASPSSLHKVRDTFNAFPSI